VVPDQKVNAAALADQTVKRREAIVVRVQCSFQFGQRGLFGPQQMRWLRDLEWLDLREVDNVTVEDQSGLGTGDPFAEFREDIIVLEVLERIGRSGSKVEVTNNVPSYAHLTVSLNGSQFRRRIQWVDQGKGVPHFKSVLASLRERLTERSVFALEVHSRNSIVAS